MGFRQRFRRPPRRFWIFSGLLAIFVLWAESDELTVRVPKRCRSYLQGRISRALKTDGVATASDFEGRFPVDSATRIPLHAPNTCAVPGVRGTARRFDSSETSLAMSNTTWVNLGTHYSVFVRLRLRKNWSDDQDILCDNDGRDAGLSLRGGHLRFSVPVEGRAESLVLEDPAPLRHPKRFHSLVGVVGAGRASFYVDGVLLAESNAVPSLLSRHRISVGGSHWNPLHADVDEFAVWSRALSAKEVSAVSSPRYDLPLDKAPVSSLLNACFDSYERFGRLCSGAFRRVASRPQTLRKGAHAQAINIEMSPADERHFNRAHAESFRSGSRTKRGADWRRVGIVTKRGKMHAELALDNPYASAFASGRPAFLLRIPGESPDDGPSCFRLFAAEDYLALHPGDEIPLELNPDAYFYLTIEKQIRGLYVMEPFERSGMASVVDRSAWTAKSFYRARPARMFREEDLLPPDELNRRARDIRNRVLRDPLSVWSKADWRRAFHAAAAQASEQPKPVPDAHLARGANPSPWFVTSDLDLSHPAFAAVAKWRSSRPDVVSPDGRVRQAGVERPTQVVLSGADVAGKDLFELKFRVMPRIRALPTIWLWVGTSPTKEVSSDFTMRYLPAGSETNALHLAGFGDQGGGLHHRGNTSYVKGQKKSLNLKFDAPHGLHADAASRVLLLQNGYADNTRLRNSLSYDIFRAIAHAGSKGGEDAAPEVSWCEVFVNNEYAGVYETCNRIGSSTFPGENVELFKIKALTPLFTERSARAFTQSAPDLDSRSCETSVLAFMDVAMIPDDAEFARRLPEILDMENFVSLFLTVNFTGNFDGRATNFILGHHPDGKYFFVPWDYDKTFLPDGRTLRIMNALSARAWRTMPEFQDSVKSRWQALRENGAALDEAVLMDRVSRASDLLSPYMPFEYDLLGYPTELVYENEVEVLRQRIREHLAFMDAWLLSKENAAK